MAKSDSEIVFRYDGMEYGIDLADLTGREMNIVKQYTDIRGLNQFHESFLVGDTALLAIIVGLAMARSGIDNVDFDKLLDVPSIQFDVVDKDDKKKDTKTDAKDGKQPQPESTE